jgi:hypothetical protein
MTAIVSPPTKEVALECSVLSSTECAELVAFLKAQPEIERVDRVYFATDSFPDSSTITRHIEYTIRLATEAGAVIGAIKGAFDLKEKITTWLEARKPRAEFVAILGPDGKTVKLVQKE